MNTVYVDTSVFGGCFENEFSDSILGLFNEFKRGKKKMMISELVREELNDAREEVKKQVTKVPKLFKVEVKQTVKAEQLGMMYVEAGALGYKSLSDAYHVAMATLHGADILASWNFKHIVNKEKIELFNYINQKMGYRNIKIRTPQEILNP
ncbi:hypothetical protein [[Flexibacter] sp. ATCC 35208]|uniref:hypothetical protein n=1 Tax=[Flexibacter] sp. ATCC 35208 TaxID=1936242 RepID=UPI0009C9A2A8|nr:hypothetical protein [[Flexibacter] sp. ATCC 35208]OMP79376.1 hypothetical protein BW716_09785 [[Flexibacter] sp. ATCC 35208]